MKMTLGQIMDSLIVTNLRIWASEDLKRDPDATDKEIADATRLTNVANKLRNDLIQAFDEEVNLMVETGELQKLYKQGSTKLYGKKK